jgi:hypothetical protein
MVGKVFTGRPAFEVPGRAGEEPDLIDGQQDLIIDERCAGLTGVQGFSVSEFLRPRFDRVGDPEQRELPLAGRRLPPTLEGCSGSAVGIVDVVGRGHRGGPVDRLRRGIHEAESFVPVGIDPPAVDEVFQFADAHAVILTAARNRNTGPDMESAVFRPFRCGFTCRMPFPLAQSTYEYSGTQSSQGHAPG